MKQIQIFLLLVVIFALGFMVQNPASNTGKNDKIEVSWGITSSPPITYGVIPYLSGAGLKTELGPLADYLSIHLERPVRLTVASVYELLGRLLEYDMVQLAWFSSTSFKALNRDNKWEVLCRPVRKGAIQHRGDIVVRADGGFNSVYDLKGKTFAYVDRNSGTGYVYPNLYFSKHGIDPLHFFGKIVFSGNHENSQIGLKEGIFDGAATFDIEASHLSASVSADFKVLDHTDWILNDPVVVKKSIDPELKNRILTIFVNMPNLASGPETLAHLKKIRNFEKFISEDEVGKMPVVANPSTASESR